MGGRHMISISAAVRTATGLKGGDPIRVTLTVADTPQQVTLPAGFAAALAADEQATAFFGRLSNSMQRYHAGTIAAAKSTGTRQRGIDQARLDHAVEHPDQRRALRVQRLGHLCQAAPPDVRERVEELPHWQPRHGVHRSIQRSAGRDRLQSSLDRVAPLEDRRDLGREMRAPPRFASLRSGSPNDAGRDGSLVSNRPGALRKPSTTLSGSSMPAPSRRKTGRAELVVTRSSQETASQRRAS
jgi:hypothetical protein